MQPFHQGYQGAAAGQHGHKHQYPKTIFEVGGQVVEVPTDRRLPGVQTHMGHPRGRHHRLAALPKAQAPSQHRNHQQGDRAIYDGALGFGQGGGDPHFLLR